MSTLSVVIAAPRHLCMYVHCANPVSVIILSGSLEPTGKSRGDDTELKKVSKCFCGMILYSSDYR